MLKSWELGKISNEKFKYGSGGKGRWVPELLKEISPEPFSLDFIFGPGQAGKTTLLKLLARHLINEGVDAKRICLIWPPSALSFNAIANKIGKSNKTVEAYVEVGGAGASVKKTRGNLSKHEANTKAQRYLNKKINLTLWNTSLSKR